MKICKNCMEYLLFTENPDYNPEIGHITYSWIKDNRSNNSCRNNFLDIEGRLKTCLRYITERLVATKTVQFTNHNQPERSKREDSHKCEMRCSEHCGNTVRDK